MSLNTPKTFSIEIENIVAAGEHGVQVSTPASFSYHGNASDASTSLTDTPILKSFEVTPML